MSPSRTSWSSPPPVVPSCAVLGTMRLLLRWGGVEASPRRPPTQAAAGGLPDQRRFRGRRAPGVAPAPLLPAPAVPPLPFLLVPFVLATPFAEPLAEAGGCLRATGFAPGFFAGGSATSGSGASASGLTSGRTGFWPGRGASACRLTTACSFFSACSASILR